MKIFQDMIENLQDSNEKAIVKTFENLYYINYDFKEVFKYMNEKAYDISNEKEWFKRLKQKEKINGSYKTIIELLENTTVISKFFNELQKITKEKKEQEEIFKENQKTLISVEELSKVLNENKLINYQFSIGNYEDGYYHLVNDGVTYGNKGVSSEIYGKDAFIYVRFDKSFSLTDLIEKCQNLGLQFKPERAISMNSHNGINEIDFKVKYFKGYHWDE